MGGSYLTVISATKNHPLNALDDRLTLQESHARGGQGQDRTDPNQTGSSLRCDWPRIPRLRRRVQFTAAWHGAWRRVTPVVRIHLYATCIPRRPRDEPSPRIPIMLSMTFLFGPGIWATSQSLCQYGELSRPSAMYAAPLQGLLRSGFWKVLGAVSHCVLLSTDCGSLEFLLPASWHN